MASKDEDKMLEDLAESIDTALFEWMTKFKMPALNLTAVILARLTWLAKQGNYREDFIEILKAPEEILNKEEIKPQVH